MPESHVACGQCGARLAKGAVRCGLCGAAVRDLATQARPSSEPASTPTPTTPAASPNPATDLASSFLYLCPSCGAFVRSGDVACKKCGTALDAVAENAPDTTGSTAATFRRCPQCDAVVPTAETTCGVCGTSLVAQVVPEPPAGMSASEAIARDEILAELEKLLATDRIVEGPEEPAAKPVPEAPSPAPPPTVEKREAPKAPPREVPEPSTASIRKVSMARWRDSAAILTTLAFVAVASAAAVGAPGYEWGQLLLFGVLFGIGLVFTIPEFLRLARSLPFVLWIAGTALLVAVPVGEMASAPFAAWTSFVLLGAGGGINALAAWRLPRDSGISLPWLSGLLLLTLAASGAVALLPLRDPSVTFAVWVVAGALVLGPGMLVAQRNRGVARVGRTLTAAEDALTNREYTKALRLYDEALAFLRRPDRAAEAALYGKGAALVAVGRLDDALEVLDRALSTNPRNEIAWVNKGTALTRLGRLQDALRCYNSAIKVNAAYEVAWNNKGNALSRLGRNEWALQCYEQALTLDPSYRTAWVNKGYVLAKLGRFEEAAECADHALQLTAGAAA